VSFGGGGDAVAAESFAVAAAPEAFVGDHDLRRGAGEQVCEWFVLFLVAGTIV